MPEDSFSHGAALMKMFVDKVTKSVQGGSWHERFCLVSFCSVGPGSLFGLGLFFNCYG